MKIDMKALGQDLDTRIRRLLTHAPLTNGQWDYIRDSVFYEAAEDWGIYDEEDMIPLWFSRVVSGAVNDIRSETDDADQT